jgi:hypothetical protein
MDYVFQEKKHSLRKLLIDESYHNSNKISSDVIKNDPTIHMYLQQISEIYISNPSQLFDIHYDVETLKKDWNNLVTKDVSQNIDARCKSGHKIIDMFMSHIWDVQNYKGKSIRGNMNHETMYKALLLNLQIKDTPYRSELRRSLGFVIGLSNVTKYKAVITKKICIHFNAKSVFDPCIGWGGRMLGTLCLGNKYVGCEPDHNTFEKLQQILNHESIPTDIKPLAHIINKPFEIAKDDINDMFDMVLTSPPYYNLEVYTNGLQSVNTYPSWDKWIKWYENMIMFCLSKLNQNGTSCWSVKDFKTDKKYPLATLTIKIHDDNGWELVKTFKTTGSSRPSSTAKISEELTYCFKIKKGS